MHHCYILYSKKVDRYYVGETIDINERLILHNTGYFSGSYTKQASDWELKLLIQCNDTGHAKRIESFIKRMKSRIFIEKLLNDPVLVKDITEKTKPQ